MSARKLLTIAAVSALLLGGVAAVSAADPGAMGTENASTDQVPDEAQNADDADAPAENADSDMPAQAGGAENGSNTADRSNSVGPSDGYPEQVPDHVSEIHNAIESFLNDTISDLGETISSIVDSSADTSEDAGNDDGEEMSDDEEMDDSNETAAPADVPA